MIALIHVCSRMDLMKWWNSTNFMKLAEKKIICMTELIICCIFSNLLIGDVGLFGDMGLFGGICKKEKIAQIITCIVIYTMYYVKYMFTLPQDLQLHSNV